MSDEKIEAPDATLEYIVAHINETNKRLLDVEDRLYYVENRLDTKDKEETVEMGRRLLFALGVLGAAAYMAWKL